MQSKIGVNYLYRNKCERYEIRIIRKDRGESIIPTMTMRAQSISERGSSERNEGDEDEDEKKRKRERERERGGHVGRREIVKKDGGRGHVTFGSTDRRWDPLDGNPAGNGLLGLATVSQVSNASKSMAAPIGPTSIIYSYVTICKILLFLMSV